jgi:hypothetical protein
VVVAEPLLVCRQIAGEGPLGLGVPALRAPYPRQVVPGCEGVGVVAATLLLVCRQNGSEGLLGRSLRSSISPHAGRAAPKRLAAWSGGT